MPEPSQRPQRPATSEPLVVSLAEAARIGLGADQLGSKAATLARLAAAGVPVPAGFVIPADALTLPDPDRLAGALRDAALGLGRLAVRSSAVAEDLPEASYAGLYETVLDVDPAGLAEAVARVHASAGGARVAAYQHHQDQRVWQDSPAHGGATGGPPAVAVLVQPMLHASAAGVAFTANPISGARDEVVITAVSGLGERLVAGQAGGQEWVVRGDQVTCTRQAEQAITPGQAREVAALARRVQDLLGAPQDIEWAIQAGKVWLLQARPMTALGAPVDWTPPANGVWLRSFRLGEWLPDPMTPLFADWLLPCLEDGFAQGMHGMAGASLPFRSAAVNGWYYTSPNPDPRAILSAVATTRGRILRFVWAALILPFRDPVAADRRLLGALAQRWRTDLLPRYQHLIANREQQAATSPPEGLRHIVTDVARLAGEDLWSLAVVGGAAWKMEAALARFARRYLPHLDGGGVQRLLAGLPGTEPDLPAHAVHSLDPVHPTAGELGWRPQQAGGVDQHQRLAAERHATTDRCLATLAAHPRRRARFAALLVVTQQYAVLREQQARSLTLGWPLLRACVLRLGQTLADTGMVDQPGDVFFLARADFDQPGQRTSLREVVTRRRATWARQRRLAAPLILGTPNRLLARLLHTTQPAAGDAPAGTLAGQPASPGTATGVVRIITDPADFDAFQPGEVLVARATAPAWTPLFAKAAAVVTDAGTMAAHASLVAREYAIPAVVGTGEATSRLRTGQVVTVDGTTGHIHPRG